MRTEQLKLNHMYEISKGNAPDCMTSKFEKSNNIHVTRNSMSVFNIPSHNMCYVMSEDHNGNKCLHFIVLSVYI